MTDPRIEDHAVGIELQLVELVEQEQRAEVQGRVDDAAQLEDEIESLQVELAATAEQLGAAEVAAAEQSGPRAEVGAPIAQELVDL